MMLRALRSLAEYVRLSPLAREVRRCNRRGIAATDPGNEAVIPACIGWLCRAQDRSRSADGGVARDFSLLDGWSSSYPETTGYIVPTILDRAVATGDDELRTRARRMLDWLVSIQLPDGAFQGGKIDSTPVVPVTFNTGQILLGLASGTALLGEEYREPMRRAATWLVESQDPDGAWRRHPSPFAASGDRTYDTHVSWGLLEAARLEPREGYLDAAVANVRWALRSQDENGWFHGCCLTDPETPLTHTIGYALRGVIEAHRSSHDPTFLEAAERTAASLLGALRGDGFLPGRLRRDWSPAVSFACLTGTAQIAHCWGLLHELTGKEEYLRAHRLANSFVRRTVSLDGPEDIRGAVQGSFPVHGSYGAYQYCSWGNKFLVDSCVLEETLCGKLEEPGSLMQIDRR